MPKKVSSYADLIRDWEKLLNAAKENAPRSAIGGGSSCGHTASLRRGQGIQGAAGRPAGPSGSP